MKLIYFLVAFLIATTAKSQCKYTVDEFTQKESIENDYIKVAKNFDWIGSQLLMSCEYIKEYLVVSFKSMHPKITIVDTDDITYVKLNDGKILKYQTYRYQISDRSKNPNNAIYFIEETFVVEKEDLKLISEIGIAKVRVKYQDFTVSKSGNDKLKSQITCLLREYEKLKAK